MSAIFFLIIIGVIVAGGFLIAFVWAVRSGQYDDDYSPSVRMLFENKKTKTTEGEGDTSDPVKDNSEPKTLTKN
jgi:cbb3-type cytochrome oxidase maturation protein